MSDADNHDVEYGPLAGLIGTWEGDKGMDVSPEPEGDERSAYYETIVFEACGTVDNHEEDQVLAFLRYNQAVYRKTNNKMFHNESGYYTWDVATGVVVQSFVIPRSVGVIAGGTAEFSDDPGRVRITVAASLDDDDYGIIQAPFMRDNASTQSFSHTLELDGDQLTYTETTVVDIYGRVFDHTDTNTLHRVV